MRKTAKAMITAASSVVLALGLATSASANGNVTWKSNYIGLCLGHIENAWGDPYEVAMRSCGSNGQSSNGWYEELQSDHTWLLKADNDHSYCLTAYNDHDVYMEKCSGNDWQRWYENKTASDWRLGHKATNWYLTATDNGTGITVQPWNGGVTQSWS
ncbi:hypothetical protein [Streptomyces sp. NPDC058755]|uniref:hypothetical protein n=1 Tax=unclassified Streptomyces TaxID=2593676 RepID=UPI0036A445EF